MRKVTEQAAIAFNENKNFKSNNTQVINEDGIMKLLLHGNLIARKDIANDLIEISNAGWKSNTTKERLNGIRGVNISQKAGEWFLNGEKWSGNWIIID